MRGDGLFSCEGKLDCTDVYKYEGDGSPSNYLLFILHSYGASVVAQMVKNLPATWEVWV